MGMTCDKQCDKCKAKANKRDKERDMDLTRQEYPRILEVNVGEWFKPESDKKRG